MKYLLAILITVFACASALPVYANDAHHTASEAAKNYSAKGNVVAIDKTAGKIKLKHEAIPDLDWPAMTMFFQVADKKLLDGLKIGDTVEFQFDKPNGSGPVITRINPLK